MSPSPTTTTTTAKEFFPFQIERQYCCVQSSFFPICTIISISRRRLRLARIRLVRKHSASGIGFVYVSLIETRRKKPRALPLLGSLSLLRPILFVLEEKKRIYVVHCYIYDVFLHQSNDLFFFNKVC